MPVVKPPKRASAPGDFKIFTRELELRKAADDAGKDQLYIEGCASSTVIDRGGDRISLACQQKMLNQVKAMTLWLNHSYEVPEDVFGTCEESYLKTAEDPEQGQCTELWIRARVDQNNDRAVKAYTHITEGTKLGFSIGGRILDWEFEDTPDGDWVFIITDIDLFEVSVVGIPANQRAYIEQMAKALRKSIDVRPEATAKPTADELAAKRSSFLDAIKNTPRPTVGKPKLSPKMLEIARNVDPEIREKHPQIAKLLDQLAADAATGSPEVKPSAIAGLMRTIKELTDDDGVDDENAETPLSDDQQEVLCSAMQHISDAAGHGVCKMAMESLKAAHGKIGSLLPKDSDAPEWEEAGATVIDVKAIESGRISKAAEEAEQQIADRAKALNAELDNVQKLLETKREELMEIEARIATRGAIPLGRRSAAYASGSYGTRTTDPTHRARSAHEIARDLSRAKSGETDDARLRSIR